MSTSLEVKLRTAAAAYAPLVALLGSSPFRWFDTQMPQGAAFPAVVAQLISNPADYYLGGQMHTSWARMQMTVWDTDAEGARTLETAISDFLQQFTASGVAAGVAKPNYILNTRQGYYAQAQPPQYQRIIDAKIYDNDQL